MLRRFFEGAAVLALVIVLILAEHYLNHPDHGGGRHPVVEMPIEK